MGKKWHIWSWFLFIIILLYDGYFCSAMTGATQTGSYNNRPNLSSPVRSRAFYGPDAPYNVTPSYTKLDRQGNPLPDTAKLWSMVKDNVTGLIWEVKGNKDGIANYGNPHDADNTYTWYGSNPLTNGGKAGAENAPRDTESFLALLNSHRFGGYSDWRLPSIKELIFLVNHNFFSPSIDRRYFPETKPAQYWSGTTARIPYGAWSVGFSFGFDGSYYKGYYFCAMAVRGGK